MYQAASFTGFVRTILIILLIYYGIKILSRLFAPYLVRYMSKKMQERYGGQFNSHQNTQQPQKEGETVIDKIPNKKTASNKKVGEYIDYEEID